MFPPIRRCLPTVCCLVLGACAGEEPTDCGEYGCEVSETFQVRSASDKREAQVPWSSQDLLVQGSFRDIRFKKGEGEDAIAVEFVPQARVPFDTAQSDVDKKARKLRTQVDVFDDHISITADGPAAVSAQLILELPSAFSGQVRIEKSEDLHGTTTLNYLGNARELIVDTESTGSVVVKDAASLRNVFVFCKGSVDLGSLSSAHLNQVEVDTQLGNVVAGFDALPEASATLTSRSGGNVEVEVAAYEGLALTALAVGIVEVQGLPASCTQSKQGRLSQVECDALESEPGKLNLESAGKVIVRFQ